MRHRPHWPLTGLLAIALTACNVGPTPAPPTPTPRARAEQIARATEVAAQITATAAARSLPTATPTPRPTIAARPTFVGKPGNGKPLKATPIEWHAAPLEDGRRYRDQAGQFAVTIPQDWEEYPPDIVGAAALFVAPFEPDGRQPEMNIFVWEMPKANWVLPLSDITNMAMADVREFFGEDYVFERLERIEANGVQIDRLICQDADDEYQLVQAYMVVNHTLHILTFHSPSEQFEANLPLFDSILASYSTTGK